MQSQEKEGWGAKIIDQLSRDLRKAFPDMKGFSTRNLKYMRKFAKEYPDIEFVQQVAAQLPWFHIAAIMDRVKEMEGKTKQSSDWINLWRNGNPINGAEKYADFKKRVVKGLQKAMKCLGPVLIVSHGGVYWAIQEILNLAACDLPNATPVYHNNNTHFNLLKR